MTENRPPAAPRGLGAEGRKLWRSVVADFEPSTAERNVLVQACRTADELERLKTELDASPVMTTGSMGQPKPNPLLAEVRAHRSLLDNLLRHLDLIGAEDEQDDRAATVKAMVASRARWGEGRVMGR